MTNEDPQEGDGISEPLKNNNVKKRSMILVKEASNIPAKRDINDFLFSYGEVMYIHTL